MNIAAVSHRSTIEYCYASDKDTVTVTILTDKDVSQAFLIWGDPFIHELMRTPEWHGEKIEMRILAELKNHYLWAVSVRPKYKRLRYYFELVSGGQHYVVCENKICPIEENEAASMACYKYAWINSSDIIAPPEWVKRTVWYQIMPDRFCRSKDSPLGQKFRAWGDFSNPGWNDLYGGNLKGITERLGYLKELGISGVYLTPIFRSNTNHKYNTFDYWEIDPDFGTEEDIRELVDTAHSLGIRVMLDAVFNHCGSEFFACRDVFEKGADSPYYDWFFINSEDFRDRRFSTEDGRFFSFSFWAGMPKLNTNHPEVVRYFCELCTYWVKDWKIDGIRFDVGDEVSHTFIRTLHDTLKSINPDVFLLGEIWTDAISWLGGREYDSVMNYPLPGCINDFFAHPAQSFSDFIYALNYCRTMYPEQTTEVLFNFLDTHDTPRVGSISSSEDEVLLKLALLMTLPGSPCIYYGTEIAMKGNRSPYNRSTMPWSKIERGMYDAFMQKVAALIRLRHTRKDFISNDIEYIRHRNHPRLLHYQKSGTVDIYLNAEKEPCRIDRDGNILFRNHYADRLLQPEGILILEANGLTQT